MRVNYKNILIFLVLILGIYGIYKKMPSSILKNSQYENKSIEVMKKLNVYDEVHKYDYSKTIEQLLLNNSFNEKYIKEYSNINYNTIDNFDNIINIFLEKNYTSTEINNILENLSESNINKLLTKDYIKLDKYYSVINLNVDNVDRYNKYKSEKNISLEDAVTQVNIGLDNKYYTEIKNIDNPDDLLVLVNKYRALPENYEPDDLVTLSNGKQFKLRRVAAEAYEELIKYASSNGIDVLPFSGYRSYNTQKVIYNNHVNNNGRDKADTYSARPGHSEHQLGLAVDIRSKDYHLKRLTPEDAKWVNDNCSKFGFIVRYTKEDEFITGYQEETWHLRFVGKDIAKKVMESGITYDEYYDLYIEKY